MLSMTLMPGGGALRGLGFQVRLRFQQNSYVRNLHCCGCHGNSRERAFTSRNPPSRGFHGRTASQSADVAEILRRTRGFEPSPEYRPSGFPSTEVQLLMAWQLARSAAVER